jgi:hypothetical protein
MADDAQNNNNVIAFICQPGEIEIKALLLAYTLRKNLKIKVDPIALIPFHFKSQINSSSFFIFSKLNVEIRYFENLFIANKEQLLPGDAMSNKFYGLESLPDKQNILFLDSDIICLKTFSQELFRARLAAKPAGYSLNTRWDSIYQLAGISFPTRRIKCTVDEVESPPYFNTGVIFISKELKANLCEWWKEYFLFFSKKEMLEENLFNPFHRDQLAFALATEKLGINVILLDKSYNYYVRRRKLIHPDTFLVHYHDCYTIFSIEALLNLFSSFQAEFPEVMNILNHFLPWKLLANQYYFLLRLFKIYKKLNEKIMRV